jgi:hypothetical protein
VDRLAAGPPGWFNRGIHMSEVDHIVIDEEKR